MKFLPKIFLFFFLYQIFNFQISKFNLVRAEPLNVCPAEIYLCGTPGPENNPFYPYPGSSCYKYTKDPKAIINYNVQAQKTIYLPYSTPGPVSYSWNFTAGAEAENLKIPVVREVAELFEGEEPFGRKISLDSEGNPILENFGPISKLTVYNPVQDKLKQIIAVSAIDSQYEAPNPIHDYIIAYAIPAQGHSPSPSGPCNDKDWWYGGEEFKNNSLARPIRASEPDCTAFLKSGAVPFHSEANIQSRYAGVVCPKLYGQPHGLYVQKLKSEGKIFCPLSEQVLVEVWKKFMPLVSHEAEPAQITLTFDGKPAGEGKIYLPHLARLEQISSIFKAIQIPKEIEEELDTTIVNVSSAVSKQGQELVCPAKIDLLPTPAQGGGNFEIQVPLPPIITPTPSHFSETLRQSGNLQIAIPEILKIKENLIGKNGFFRAWLPVEIVKKLEEEIAKEGDAAEGEGKIRIIPKDNVDSIYPSEFVIKYPYLNAIDKYYQEFLKLLIPPEIY